MSVLNTMSTILLIWTVITTNTRTQADTDTGRELYDSSERGDLAQVRQLLGSDCTDVNKLIEQPGDWDRAALHAAAFNNHTKVVMYLLSCGADPNIHGDKGQTPLYLASALGHIGAVRVLLGARADTDYKDTNKDLGWTPLIIASGNGHIKTMKALISAGADIDLQSHAGTTALMLASEYNHLDAVKTLISAGANVNLATNSTLSYIQIIGNTALMYARCNLDVVKELLSAGADIDATTSIGETALILASSKGCVDVVKELLSKGADVNLLRATGDSALMIGLENDQSDTYSNITTALIEYGVNMTIQNDFKGETALHIATKGNRIEAVKTLLKHGADTKVMTYAEQTAEDIARTNDFTDILKLIQQSTVCNNLYQ